MSPSAPAGRPILFCDRGCPYTHRVLALLEHLGVDFEMHAAAIGTKPEGVEQHSRSGRIPLLVHEGLAITESWVMLEYLAERYGFDGAYPADLAARTRHRHAIAVASDYLMPLLFPGGGAANEARTADVLDALEAASATAPPRPSMLVVHLGPMWHSFRSWHPQGAATRAVRARVALHGWLEAAADLPCVTRSATNPDVIAADLQRARSAGLIPELFDS